jgi:ABC-type glutathione transport system ATPase component
MQNENKYKMLHTFTLKISSRDRLLVSIENFSFYENTITILLGESGIGKSMIVHALYGLLNSKLLQVTINHQPVANYLNTPYAKEIRKNSFFVFQEPSTHLNPMLKLDDQLHEGDLTLYQDHMENIYRLWQETPVEKIKDLLALYPKPYRPSGGEKQRILIAMAFQKIDLWQSNYHNSNHTLYVFDEPTGNLDNFYRNIFIKLLFDKYRRKPFSIMLITHDYSLISEIKNKHIDLFKVTFLKELTRHNGRLVVNDFASKRYFSWLQKSRQVVSQGKLLFHLSEHICVFNRKLKISKDQEGRQSIPLTIHAHEIVYLKARSGIGKTTLAKVIMGIVKAESFTLQIGVEKINECTPPSYWRKKIWARKMGMVFQHADEALNQNARVLEIFKGLPVKINKQQLIGELQHLLGEQIDPAFLQKKVAFLSGGQKQKLNLLRTFLINPDILILDEPLNSLDFESIKKVITYLIEKQTQGKGILLISHNEEIFDHFIPPESTFYLQAE